MELKLNSIFLLVILISVDQTFPAVFLNFEKQSAKDYYFESRGVSNHRGLLLSYSSTKKKQICTDLFSENVHSIMRTQSKLAVFRGSFKGKITDEDLDEGKPKHSSIVGRISAISRLFRLNDHHKDIFFKCIIEDLPSNVKLDRTEYFVSSAFGSGLMYAGHKDYMYDNEVNVLLMQYMLSSPEFVPLEQNQLEKQYVLTRSRIKGLEEESEEYIKLIDQKDDISELSPWQTYLLCSSIILSPNQKGDLHKFSLTWTDYKEDALNENVPRFENKHLAFKNGAFKNMKWTADCVNCRSSADIGGILPLSVKIFFTRTLDDKYSVYVLREENGTVYLSDYIKNVPVLMNSKVPITNDPPREETLSQEYH